LFITVRSIALLGVSTEQVAVLGQEVDALIAGAEQVRLAF
jgi:hypothetical protein